MDNNSGHLTPAILPRVAITFCTQCRWMLRAAYFGQELLSTFGTSIGEIALIPATGGKFVIALTYQPESTVEPVAEDNFTDSVRDAPKDQTVKDVVIWDYKVERCFPETKILKQKIRNHIDPGKSLGHSDKPSSKAESKAVASNDAGETSSRPSAPASSVAVESWFTPTWTDPSVPPATSITSSKPSTPAPNGPVLTGEHENTNQPEPAHDGSESCKDCA